MWEKWEVIRNDSHREHRSSDYLMIRDKILAIGIEALPEVQINNKKEPEELLRELRFFLPYAPTEKSKISWTSIFFGGKS